MFYDLIALLCRPSAWWGRMRVEGLDAVPAAGPLLVVPNHDSQWDPIIVGLAILPRRSVRFLARSGLWRIPGLGPILDGLGQIPIRRGRRDEAGMARALEHLRDGEALTVFPEGRLSWGQAVRARSGVGLLATWCPDAHILLCAIEGATDYVRFPRRPNVTVRFFAPEAGGCRPDESPTELAARLLAELRARVPPVPAGRQAIIGGPPRIQRALARQAANREGSLRE